MADLKIGETSYKTRRPADLDAQLVASTGCSAAEIDKLIASGPDRMAHAVAPFLGKDAPEHCELARAIAADPAAAESVRQLYLDKVPDAVPALTEGSANG